jgi:aspartate aminotransferase
VAFVTSKASTARKLESVLEHVQRATISTPPAYGAKLVSAVLGTPALKAQWDEDIVTMSNRIISVRQRLYQGLLALNTPGDWSHIISQTGMFGFLELNPSQVAYLKGIC